MVSMCFVFRVPYRLVLGDPHANVQPAVAVDPRLPLAGVGVVNEFHWGVSLAGTIRLVRGPQRAEKRAVPGFDVLPLFPSRAKADEPNHPVSLARIVEQVTPKRTDAEDGET